ncbi:similar to origin recognition complex subunit 3 [Botrytis cinerea T4]|uniref:Similar to origin recognition complex subunit 3 n=1 Tax=Botryotinia fuckeliana (strain T4) TaxID=999810 RepID=G2XYG0_BOTF4|nr:similar to origin recognition complex subunit 3 [Botrytis cinerea T4]
MSLNGDTNSLAGFDGTEHQAAYVFTPASVPSEDLLQRPKKRRKVGKAATKAPEINDDAEPFKLAPLFNEKESEELSNLRLNLFHKYWPETETKIQSILNEANEGTLLEVTSFVENERSIGKVPAGFIVTGPNIASQGLLFEQLSTRLSNEFNGPVVTLRSGESSNLKALLKKLIRDVTHQKSNGEDENDNFLEQDGRKLLNYDLETVYGYVKAHGCDKVIVSFQDSEAFDSGLLGDTISLFSSWLDRIPFLLLFGIATSVELFQERLSRVAARSLHGAQFDVEQTSSILENIFLKVIAGSDAPIRLGPGILSSLMERQNDHVQSVQAFVGALKYAYMCHFYANPLSIFLGLTDELELGPLLQTEHFEAIRMLPSFQKHTERLVDQGELEHAMGLLNDDGLLLQEVKTSIQGKDHAVQRILRTMHVLVTLAVETPEKIDLYIKASTGSLRNSDIVRSIVDSVKRASLDDFLEIVTSLKEGTENGSTELDLEPWSDMESEFYSEITSIRESASSLAGSGTGKSIRSSYNKALRTTLISQKVQISQDRSMLTKQDKEFTALVDHLIQAIQNFVDVEKLQDQFVSEIWLYDLRLPYLDAFTPKPRFTIERALSSPHDYLSCACCDPTKEGALMSHPPTAILYKLFLEAGNLINTFDLWTAFIANLGPEYDEGDDSERQALMLFYRGLADLKLLGMIKQSRKKTDHLTKLAWKGL